jgi:hypothetical protein
MKKPSVQADTRKKRLDALHEAEAHEAQAGEGMNGKNIPRMVPPAFDASRPSAFYGGCG